MFYSLRENLFLFSKKSHQPSQVQLSNPVKNQNIIILFNAIYFLFFVYNHEH